MRRYVLIALFILVLITPLVLRTGANVPHELRRTSNNAQTLVVVSPHAENIRTEFADAFSDWHQQHYGQPVFVDYRIYGGATDIVRYFDSAKATLYKSLGTYQVDIVWGGGDDLFDNRLRAAGHLEGVRLSDEIMHAAFAQPKINGLALYDLNDDPPQWFGTALSSFGIVYNKDVLRYLGVNEPTQWSDLRDPRYRGWIVLADPTRSAVARTAFMLIVEREMQEAIHAGKTADEGWARGMGLIRQIASNARLFTDSGSVVSGVVSTGDAAAGMAIDFQARSQLDAVRDPTSGQSRLGYIEPVGVTSVDPVALVKGAEHREVAIHFIEFLLSDPGQRLWITRAGAPGGPKQTSLRRMPVRKDVYDHPSNFTDEINPWQQTVGDFNATHAAVATSGILAELIQMSCIDPLDDLQRVPTEKLGDFPFGQTEALARLARWKTASPADRLRLGREWTEEFRQEYRRLQVEKKD